MSTWTQYHWTPEGMEVADFADDPGDPVRYVRLRDFLRIVREYRDALSLFTDDVGGLLAELAGESSEVYKATQRSET